MVAPRWLSWAAAVIAVIIIALDVKLLGDAVMGRLESLTPVDCTLGKPEKLPRIV